MTRGGNALGIANGLTIMRVLLVPLFMYFFFSDFVWSIALSLLIFVLASLTDTLDGYIARKYNQVTTFGKFMDPLADKILVAAALISFVEKQYIPSWMAVIIVSREFIVTGFRILAMTENKIISAGNWGKVKTVAQVLIVILVLLRVQFSSLAFWFWEFDRLVQILEILTVALTVYSGVDYIARNRNLLNFN